MIFSTTPADAAKKKEGVKAATAPPAVAAASPTAYPAPSEIVAAAKAEEWVTISPNDLLVMDLAADAQGRPRRVVIQLMPAPFSQGWIGNIRKLAAARFWDGTSVNRVQDNYVVQWGDVTEKKALPDGLVTVGEGEYRIPLAQIPLDFFKGSCMTINTRWSQDRKSAKIAAFTRPIAKQQDFDTGCQNSDPYAQLTASAKGFPFAYGARPDDPEDIFAGVIPDVWPVHCYGMVGVGRNLSPDTGSGAELYTVIGHAPRHLDHNIALVGRVIEGIEHLSSLPRGTGALGFYEKAKERVPILSVDIMSHIPTDKPFPRYEYLSTESASFAKYADARANRQDPFFIKPAGGADICNIPVPVRRK